MKLITATLIINHFHFRSELLEMTTKKEQSVEEKKNCEIKIENISVESLNARELFKAEKDKLYSKLNSFEHKIKGLNEEAVAKDFEIIELGEKLQDILNENGKLKEERTTLEETLKGVREKDIQISSLDENLQVMKSQLEVFRGQEKELKSKLELSAKDNLMMEEVLSY